MTPNPQDGYDLVTHNVDVGRPYLNRITALSVRVCACPPSQGCFPDLGWRASPRGDFPPLGGLRPSVVTHVRARERTGEGGSRGNLWQGYVRAHTVHAMHQERQKGTGWQKKYVSLQYDM